MIKNLFMLALLGLIGCTKELPTAQEVVDQAIDFSGTENRCGNSSAGD